jgi:hypothetical protein
VLYGGDAQWWKHYRREIDKTEGEHWCTDDGVPGVNAIRGLDPDNGGIGMSTAAHCIHTGGNSGYAALNLIALWGPLRIILVGYDMQASGGRLHCHRDHPPALGNPVAGGFVLWRQRFAVAAQDLRRMGIEVVNCSRQTALRCFEQADLEDELPRPEVFVRGMLGLGDNLYQRPYVRELTRGHRVYLSTPWPQLYADMTPALRLFASRTTLRTQARNEARTPTAFATESELRATIKRGCAMRAISYVNALHSGHSMWHGLRDTFGIEASGAALDLPPLPPSPIVTAKPVCLVRPVTVRKEWLNPARNPLPEYVRDVARWLRREGMHVVSIADLKDGEETAIAPLPEADESYHAGEFDALQLLAIVQAAAAVCGPVGWILPAAIAAHVPAFIILGGQGGHNAPERITVPSMADDLLGWGMPDEFCRCTSSRHACRKGNAHLREQFDQWRLRVARSAAPALVA